MGDVFLPPPRGSLFLNVGILMVKERSDGSKHKPSLLSWSEKRPGGGERDTRRRCVLWTGGKRKGRGEGEGQGAPPPFHIPLCPFYMKGCFLIRK